MLGKVVWDASPQGGRDHWINSRSAKELARCWFPDTGFATILAQLGALLNTAPEFEDFRLNEPNQNYLPLSTTTAALLTSIFLGWHSKSGRTNIVIEAKAVRQKLPIELDALCRCFFGKEFGDLPASHGIYYRLFSGVPELLLKPLGAVRRARDSSSLSFSHPAWNRKNWRRTLARCSNFLRYPARRRQRVLTS